MKHKVRFVRRRLHLWWTRIIVGFWLAALAWSIVFDSPSNPAPLPARSDHLTMEEVR